LIASLCWALHVAPRDLLGDDPEAFDPAMIDTLVNYGNWQHDQAKVDRQRARSKRRRG
jgi:hypothetical protein